MNPQEQALIDALPYLTKLGYSPWGPYIQARHETGNFQHVIGKANYWGMKPNKAWKGEVIVKTTHEYVKGKMIQIDQPFKGFPDALAAVANYDERIQKLYPLAYEHRGEVLKFFIGLISGPNQWATDPHYVTQLTSLYRVCIGNPDLVKALGGMV